MSFQAEFHHLPDLYVASDDTPVNSAEEGGDAASSGARPAARPGTPEDHAASYDAPAESPASSMDGSDGGYDSAGYEPPAPEKPPTARPQASSATTVQAPVDFPRRATRSTAPPPPPGDLPPCPPPLPPDFVDNVSWIITGEPRPEFLRMRETRALRNQQRARDTLDRTLYGTIETPADGRRPYQVYSELGGRVRQFLGRPSAFRTMESDRSRPRRTAVMNEENDKLYASVPLARFPPHPSLGISDCMMLA